jgi:nucleoside-diphosphate-sugar epimerase
MPQLFCFGLGYSALHYLRSAKVEGAAGTVREPAPHNDKSGARAFTFDTSDAALRLAIRESERVLVSIPPDADGDPVLRHFSDSLRPDACIVYLSSLGVYGDYAGAVVTEKSECRPRFPRSRARLAAELAWTRLAEHSGSRLVILRLAGIYGPQRNALAQVKRREARRIAKPGQIFNRIHVADIAQTIDASFESGARGVFNAADDEPSPPGDPIAFAAKLLGAPPPPEIPFEQARQTMSPMALSFYEECRRADNARMKSVLGVRLRYPTYREGLQALFDGGQY